MRSGNNVIAHKLFGGDEDRYNIYCNVVAGVTLLSSAVSALGMGAKAYLKKNSSFRESMTPEEALRYDNYWDSAKERSGLSDYDYYYALEEAFYAERFAQGYYSGAKGLIGIEFETFLTQKFGGNGSFSKGGRDFDGGVGNRWWEAKSGQFWDMLLSNARKLLSFKSDMGDRLKIARDNGATYELFSNTPIPQLIKEWLIKKGIPFTEFLD